MPSQIASSTSTTASTNRLTFIQNSPQNPSETNKPIKERETLIELFTSQSEAPETDSPQQLQSHELRSYNPIGRAAAEIESPAREDPSVHVLRVSKSLSQIAELTCLLMRENQHPVGFENDFIAICVCRDCDSTELCDERDRCEALVSLRGIVRAWLIEGESGDSFCLSATLPLHQFFLATATPCL